MPTRFSNGRRSSAACFSEAPGPQEVHVVASQYLIAYVLIEAVQRFHGPFPQIHVRLSARTEHEIEEALLDSTRISRSASPRRTSRRRSWNIDICSRCTGA